jgi:hypothetical protein
LTGAPLQHRDVGAATATGVVFVCAMCDRYWWARERGLPYCGATARGQACCGPWGGDTYPAYAGPLQGHLEGVCFLCGAPSTAGVAVAGRPGLVGVCATHEPLLHTYGQRQAPGERAVRVQPAIEVKP